MTPLPTDLAPPPVFVPFHRLRGLARRFLRYARLFKGTQEPPLPLLGMPGNSTGYPQLDADMQKAYAKRLYLSADQAPPVAAPTAVAGRWARRLCSGLGSRLPAIKVGRPFTVQEAEPPLLNRGWGYDQLVASPLRATHIASATYKGLRGFERWER